MLTLGLIVMECILWKVNKMDHQTGIKCLTRKKIRTYYHDLGFTPGLCVAVNSISEHYKTFESYNYSMCLNAKYVIFNRFFLSIVF